MKFAVLFFLLCLSVPALNQFRGKGEHELLRVCYYTLFDPEPRILNTSLCTHIIAGFSSVTDGVLDLGDDANKKMYVETTNLKKVNPQLKVLITVGGGGNDNGFSSAFNSTQNRTRFISSVFSVLKQYNFDGLDIDWEFPVWNDYALEDKENFIEFLKEFKAASVLKYNVTEEVPPLLTVAVAAPSVIVNKAYDIPEMAKYVDFINLMSYDFHDYIWYTPFTGHNSPLFNRSAEKAYFATLNTAWSAHYWNQQGMPKSKIMVGIPTYAHTYILSDPKLHGVDAPASGSYGDLNFYDVCKFLASGGMRVFDNESEVPYAYLNYDWISYEDQISVKVKANWIKSQGYGGAMTYKLNSDDWPCTCSKVPFLLHQIIHDVFTM